MLVEACKLSTSTPEYSLYNRDFTLSVAAATAAKPHQSCLTLCDPIDGSPTGSSVRGILQARILEWVAISFSNAWKWKVKVKSLSHVWLLVTPWTVAYQAPLSMGFSRQEYWSGLPLPSPTLSVDQVWNHVWNAWCLSETQQAPQFQDLFFGEDIQPPLLPPTNSLATKQIPFHWDAAVRKPSFKLLIYKHILSRL